MREDPYRSGFIGYSGISSELARGDGWNGGNLRKMLCWETLSRRESRKDFFFEDQKGGNTRMKN